jgi:hypothetical protein
MTNEKKIKLGQDLESLKDTDGFKALNEYIKVQKEAIKELSVNPGFKDFETYKSYIKAYLTYEDIEQWIDKAIEVKNKLIQDESQNVADAAKIE